MSIQKLREKVDEETAKIYAEVHKTIRELEYCWIVGADQFLDGLAAELGIEKVDIKKYAKAA